MCEVFISIESIADEKLIIKHVFQSFYAILSMGKLGKQLKTRNESPIFIMRSKRSERAAI